MAEHKTFKERALELFNTVTVKDVPKPAKIITIDSKTSLHDAFETLLQNNILSAPVWDSQSQSYTGFLDIRDLVSFVVFVYDQQKVRDNTRLQDLLLHGAEQFKMFGTDGVTVSYLSRRHRFNPVQEDEQLAKVVSLLSFPTTHRVPVINSEGKVVNIVSQSTVVKLLSNKCIRIGDPAYADPHSPTLGELKLGSAPVLTVPKGETVINTFRMLDSKNKSGIALLDETKKLVGTTTGKDLGLFLKNPSLASLNRSIFDYLKEIRANSIDIKTPAIAVFEKDKLPRAIALLAATNVHRVFVIHDEANYHPERVISITDILKYLIS